MPDMIYGINL